MKKIMLSVLSTLMILSGIIQFTNVKATEIDTYDNEKIYNVDVSNLDIGESVELETFSLYVNDERTRSSTRVVDITPTAEKLSSTSYRLTYRLHLLLPDYSYSAVRFTSTILGTWLLGSPTKLSENLYKATRGQSTNVYIQTGSFEGKQGEVIQVKLTNIYLYTYMHGTLSAENSSQSFFLN